MSLELWTSVRFSMYPVLLVCGSGLALMFLRSYRMQRLPCQAWAFWLAVAAALQGAAGFGALLVSQRTGFFWGTSVIYTVGLAALVLVAVTGVVSLGLAAWHERRPAAPTNDGDADA